MTIILEIIVVVQLAFIFALIRLSWRQWCRAALAERQKAIANKAIDEARSHVQRSLRAVDASIEIFRSSGFSHELVVKLPDEWAETIEEREI